MGFKDTGLEMHSAEPRNFSEAIELIKQNPYVKILHRLNAEEQENLTQRISQSQGVIHLDIHPYYFDYDPGNPERAVMPPNNHQRYEAIKQNLADDLAQCESSIPRFILEEKEHLITTANKINRINKQSGNAAYIIPTHWGNPEPDFSDSLKPDHYRGINIEEGEQNWTELAALLTKLGVKSVIIGGTTLEVKPGQDPDPGSVAYSEQRLKKGAKNVDYTLQGCAGGAIHYLAAAGFDIEISDKTFPDSITEIEAIEG